MEKLFQKGSPLLAGSMEDWRGSSNLYQLFLGLRFVYGLDLLWVSWNLSRRFLSSFVMNASILAIDLPHNTVDLGPRCRINKNPGATSPKIYPTPTQPMPNRTIPITR
jgi:hypothetical protein